MGGRHCEKCDRTFGTKHALLQHLKSSSNHVFCSGCNRDFVSEAARLQHWRSSPQHKFCRLCNDLIDDDDEPREHDRKAHCVCDSDGCDWRVFASLSELRSHREEDHSYCVACNRYFDNEGNLEMHETSRKHQQRKPLTCPNAECEGSFDTLSDLLQHFESNSCGIDDYALVQDAVSKLEEGIRMLRP